MKTFKKKPSRRRESQITATTPKTVTTVMERVRTLKPLHHLIFVTQYKCELKKKTVSDQNVRN